MSTQPIVCSNTGLELKSAPIKPEWIIEGTPTARAAELSRSADQTATTLVWDCTPGKFKWIYDTDETIHILEGWITLDDGHAPPRRLGPGDVVFFPRGAVVRWHVESPVRKLAFFRHCLPKPLEFVTSKLRSVKRALRASKQAVATAASPIGTTVPSI